MKLTDEMKKVLADHSLGYVASIAPDGSLTRISVNNWHQWGVVENAPGTARGIDRQAS